MGKKLLELRKTTKYGTIFHPTHRTVCIHIGVPKNTISFLLQKSIELKSLPMLSGSMSSTLGPKYQGIMYLQRSVGAEWSF